MSRKQRLLALDQLSDIRVALPRLQFRRNDDRVGLAEFGLEPDAACQKLVILKAQHPQIAGGVEHQRRIIDPIPPTGDADCLQHSESGAIWIRAGLVDVTEDEKWPILTDLDRGLRSDRQSKAGLQLSRHRVGKPI